MWYGLQELNSYLTLETKTSMIVDRSAQGELLRINFNVSFPALSCEFATLDVSDALGTVGLYVKQHVFALCILPITTYKRKEILLFVTRKLVLTCIACGRND